MKRAILIAAAAVLALLVVLVATGNIGGGSGGYRVQALFDNAGLAVPGEQVRIAGANVGTIESLTVTRNNLAAVTMQISDKDFTPWYANATCAIRPQSLIGERYVDCEPGSSDNARLRRITHGPGAGSYLLPVDRTSSPIDTDIVQNISQDSVRQSLAVILNELGTGLAARGSDLNSVILRANPALAQTQKVFDILASQDKTLAQLATNASKVLGPLAKSRKQLADFIGQANTVAAATASQKQQLQQSIALLPDFLTQLRPLMSDLGRLAKAGTPDMTALGQSADSINSTFKQLVPFAAEAQTSLRSLGAAAQQSEASLEASLPLAEQLRQVGTTAKPSARLLAELTSSLQSSGAIQQLMSLLFYSAGATNGYDSAGHYGRISPIASQCNAYARTQVPGCDANFQNASSASASEGTTLSTAEVQSQARAAIKQLWSTEQPAVSGAQAQAAEQTTAQIAAQAVKQTSSGKHVSESVLAGLLRYLMGSGA